MTYCVPETSLDQIAHWLLSITKHDNCHNDTTDNKNPERFFLLQQTREYSDFIQAARRLEGAHRNLQQTWNKQAAAAAATQLAAAAATPPPANYYKATGVSFLQHVASDDVLVKIFGFLESQSLVHVSATCTRCYSLAHQSAHTRTRPLAQRRQLTAVMQLLRAHEQLCGARPAQSVRIPTLLLPRRVQVSNAGDPEYNGVYYCTGCNGNGFLFSKPRGVRRRSSSVLNSCVSEEKPLRCIIAKRFSNEVRLYVRKCLFLRMKNYGVPRSLILFLY